MHIATYTDFRSDVIAVDAHTLWGLHSTGVFVQHDLRLSSSSMLPTQRSRKSSQASPSLSIARLDKVRTVDMPSSERLVGSSPSLRTKYLSLPLHNSLGGEAQTQTFLGKTIDATPRVSLSWNVKEMLASLLHREEKWEIPYDDM